MDIKNLTQTLSITLVSILSNLTLTITLLTIETTNTHTHTHVFSGTTWVSRYQKGKTNLVFTEARDSEWQ